jgi:glycosyltransferase involved in cell wall biosynthesis
LNPPPSRLVYLFTTFPKSTETFLQREIIAMQARGLPLEIHSLWGGGGDFNGLQVRSFSKWRLLTLLWNIPLESLRKPELLRELLKGLCTRRPPSWLNFWENMLGAGFACLHAAEFRRSRPAWLHAAWGGAPATAAWMLMRMDGHRFSAAAHAYDLYEHGGDWWLNEKLVHAAFIHTSTEMGRASLLQRGMDPARVHTIRRGLPAFPTLKRIRGIRAPLRIVCIARLVAKKGLLRQIRIYDALQRSGRPFEVRIIGEGPLRGELEALVNQLHLTEFIRFTGHLPQPEVWKSLEWADVLVHTGVIAPSGDRDGLPNVIPEAMSAGVLVVSSSAAATTEAITHERTGLVADVDKPEEWVEALGRLQSNDALCQRLQAAARTWAEENYDAHKNASRLHLLFEQEMSR